MTVSANGVANLMYVVSTASIISETFSNVMEEIECIKIETMSVESFQSICGKIFKSRCGVYGGYDGCEYFFY